MLAAEQHEEPLHAGPLTISTQILAPLIAQGDIFPMWRSDIVFSLTASGQKAFLESHAPCSRMSEVHPVDGRQRLSEPVAQQNAVRYM